VRRFYGLGGGGQIAPFQIEQGCVRIAWKLK